MRTLSSSARTIAGSLLATAALAVGAAAIAAPAAEAAPQFQTLTVLNGGQILASDLSGRVVTVNPTSSTLQQWELLFPGSAGSSEPSFGSAFQLRNRATNKCVQDAGKDLQVVEVACQASPAPKSPQLWQHHTFVDRTVNGKAYQFLFNRGSGRVLSRAPIFGSAVPVLSSTKATNEGSAAAALQLWNFRKL